MKYLLKKLLDTLICCMFAGSMGILFLHLYGYLHPPKVEIVYVEKPVMPEKQHEVRVVKLGNKRMVRK